jgi:ParB/Sulfiredoxin domain
VHEIKLLPIGEIKPNPRNARTHSKKQIRQIADSISAFGFLVPVLVDETSTTLGGHGRIEAAKLLGLEKVPVIRVKGLSEAQKRALLLADNKIAANAGWDRAHLAIELPELAELLVEENLDIAITGFESVEIDQLVIDFEETSDDPADEVESSWLSDEPLSQPGDLWQLGPHRLLCGHARRPADLDCLLGNEQAAMAFLDPPYNVKVKSVVGRGHIKHREFAMASGEMSRQDYVGFLIETLGNAATHSRAGALHYVCMDWRHLGELVEAGEPTYDAQVNLVVWVKSNAGQGSFYRSQHELIGVFQVGEESHLNNVELGRHGRSTLQRLALRRREQLPGRPYGRAPGASHRQAGRHGGRRDEGLHAAAGHRARYFLWVGHHADGRGARRSSGLRTGARSPIRRRHHPTVAILYPARCGPHGDRPSLR